MDEQWIQDKLDQFDCIDKFIRKTWEDYCLHEFDKMCEEDSKLTENPDLSDEQVEAAVKKKVDEILEHMRDMRLTYAKALLKGLRFVNREGQPLQMMTPLKLDPALLEQPLYR